MPLALFVPTPQRNRAAQRSLRDFESATAEVIAKAEPRIRRVTLYVLGAMIVLAILLISVVQIDRIVTTQGRLVPIAGTLVVQPLDKGIVRNIRVAVGAIVRKGQVLATLDPTFTAADLTELQKKVASLTAQEQRIEAEEAGRTYAPGEGRYAELQLQIFRERQREFQAAVNDFDARINKDQAEISGQQQDIIDYTQRLGYAAQIERMRQILQSSGYESRLMLLTASDQRVEISRSIAESQSKLYALQHEVESLKAQRQVYIQTWHAKNLDDLVDTKNKLDEASENLAKAERMQDLADLVAPEDAVVVKIDEKASPGAVVTPAQPIFTLVPLAAPLEAEVEIAARDIGFVHVGDPVKVKFDTYRFLEHGTGDGVVKTISQDSFTEDRDHQVQPPFFRSRISITAVHLHDVPHDFRLIPGMTLNADIVVGRRTLGWYLVSGALRSGAEAMREP
jgi:hemolysin D